MSGLAITLFLRSIFAPALAGAGAALLGHKLLRGRELATALAAVAGMLCVYGDQFTWPPLQAMDWLILLIPLFALPGLLFTGNASYWTATLVVSLISTYLILHPALRFAPSPFLVIIAAGVVWTAYLAGQRKGNANHGETGALAGAALALSIVITSGGSALLGQIMGALCAATAGLLLFGFIRRQTMPLFPMHTAIFGLGLVAMVYAEIHAAWLVLPLLLAIPSSYIARRYVSSHFTSEVLAFFIALVLSAPIWGTLLVQRLSSPAAY